jgi:hypothetical protein
MKVHAHIRFPAPDSFGQQVNGSWRLDDRPIYKIKWANVVTFTELLELGQAVVMSDLRSRSLKRLVPVELFLGINGNKEPRLEASRKLRVRAAARRLANCKHHGTPHYASD